MRFTAKAALSLSAFAAACLGSVMAPDPQLIGEGRRVLFIGNSYLYTADIPGLVQAFADSAGGDKLAVETVAGPNMALIDHWHDGLATRELREGGWEWVVLQQGPSSTALNRDTLRLATKHFGGEAQAIGATTALFSAWPQANRRQDFRAAMESYELAAADVDGLFLPVAAAWLLAWRIDPDLELYADGLHPSALGAYLAAAVVYSKLLDKSPIGLPRGIKSRSGAFVILPAELADVLLLAAAQATGFVPAISTVGEQRIR